MDTYGLSRVVGEKGVLPQRARKLDPSLPCREAELLIDVESLNIDAASFKQIKDDVGGDPARIASRIQDIVRERGKMQNPVTGSGGMLIGRVKELGLKHPANGVLKPGDRIATLVSLTLTPLVIEEVKAVHADIDRVDIRGHALLFASGIYAKLPSDMPDTLALAALDVCGAPALVARHVRPGMTVAVLGAGKSGALCLAQARRSLESRGKLLALDISQKALDALSAIGLCDEALKVDATQGVDVMEAVQKATGGQLCDLVVNCASVGNTEMASLLSVKDGGTVIFFSMATSFTTAALGAEGVGKDVTMLVGNGYVPNHAALTLELLRTEPALRQLFEARYI
ncbi:L-erythro-3,5-diaminohexanoate dehydrogenase [Corallococcus sp. AB049A]|uniref:L-erythro-3,5-diaminohexanoate dehydrogenase n=1 Tax=Corallococcus interemptor TaxID=2316720 RepID=A0A3A8PM58_9BACT|nr:MULTISPECIES: L-erythro-3,5-diaminohexanoate dehydrogenase [Corallococcus]RKH38218.1 L-erythro-3,5-diaminohexanoate dehydrogenase [Corallococcus sp. AB050B]RKH57209.1 L-erythro-3,5-diaminohexanoate dehydrogenase [Corallococcus interemptor]RKI49394.1 L-erythro-3,5-diaminohexanoate dehydrogenase [Corallococcus sp. AB049A]